jgi:hypothetical protein
MELNDKNVFDTLIRPCKSGKFIFVLCKDKKSVKILKALLKEYKIPSKRGCYMWKGIIVIGIQLLEEWNEYFDYIIEVE